MPETGRFSTGISNLDGLLGGGLLPGTLTVVAGATGIGKTQLGLHFADAGARQESERGIVFDLTSRGDSQNQDAYSKRLFDWTMTQQSATEPVDPTRVWRRDLARRDYLH